MRQLLISLLINGAIAASLFAFSDKAEADLKSAIKNEYIKEYPQIAVVSIKVQEGSKENISGYRYSAIEMQRQNLTKNNGVVLAIFVNEKNETKRVFVRYEIEALLEVLKAKHNLQKDKILSQEDVNIENIALKNIFFKPLTKDELGSVSTKRFISGGTVITQKDASKPPAVRKNSIVYAVIRQDAIEIEMEVTALEDGDIGDTINVRAKNGKNMKALVASKERVEIR